MQLETITITKIVNGGYGIARLNDGRVILVRDVLPGETATVTIEERKKKLLYGKVHQITEEHTARRTAPCPYYGKCGGCDLQFCDYDTQRIVKSEILVDLLQRQPYEPVKRCVEILNHPKPSLREFGYRQRIRLQVDDQNRIGFRRFRSHEIVPIKSCLLACTSINNALAALHEDSLTDKLAELSSEIELQLNPVSGKIVCIFHFARKPRPTDIKNAKVLCLNIPIIDRIFFECNECQLLGPFGTDEAEANGRTMTLHYPHVSSTQAPLTLTWQVGGFCQVNLDQNITLIDTVIGFCQQHSHESVLDLYCGMGNFSIPLASIANSLSGFEGQGAAIRSAKANAVLANLSNTSFHKSPIHTVCDKLVEKGTKFDCVVIDPPRHGAPELANQLASICSKTLIYISCDPATLCRDLVKLSEAGFNISEIQPIDMFPQTHHIETVVLLEKK